MNVRVVEATPESFVRFGKSFKIPKGTPTARAPEFAYWSDVIDYRIDGETEIGWCTVFRQPTLHVAGVERHRKTPEILIPVDAPFILPVLREGDPPEALQAFRVNVGEAVVIDDGVWHGACLPVGTAESSYFVIFRKGTPHEDVEMKQIPVVTLEE
jgi:ureidoglycolate hydrolase